MPVSQQEVLAAIGVVASPNSDGESSVQKLRHTFVAIQGTSITCDFPVLVMAAHEYWATSATDRHGPEFLIGLDVVVVASGA